METNPKTNPNIEPTVSSFEKLKIDRFPLNYLSFPTRNHYSVLSMTKSVLEKHPKDCAGWRALTPRMFQSMAKKMIQDVKPGYQFSGDVSVKEFIQIGEDLTKQYLGKIDGFEQHFPYPYPYTAADVPEMDQINFKY